MPDSNLHLIDHDGPERHIRVPEVLWERLGQFYYLYSTIEYAFEKYQAQHGASEDGVFLDAFRLSNVNLRIFLDEIQKLEINREES